MRKQQRWPARLRFVLAISICLGLSAVSQAQYWWTSAGFSASINPERYDTQVASRGPIGGGPGYSRIVTSGTGNAVTTASELVSRLESAQSGDVIFIPGDVEIDLTGVADVEPYGGLVVPAGVTLASDRGHNGSRGALLYITQPWAWGMEMAMVEAGGNGARITGLRFRGPHGVDEGWSKARPESTGVRTGQPEVGGIWNISECLPENCEVDNCEFYYFNKYAIWAFYGKNVQVHHNYIHDGISNGYGYGLWFGGTEKAGGGPNGYWGYGYANLFQSDKHHLASSNHYKFEARSNITLNASGLNQVDRHPGIGLETILERNWFSGSRTAVTCG